MIIINKEFICKFDPCKSGIDNFIEHYDGNSFTLLELMELDKISDSDKIWLFTKNISELELLQHEFACWCAESCLHHFEELYPNDKRPRLAIEAKRAYMKGDISLEELNTAGSAAESAARFAWSVARSATRFAWSAESAAWSAAGSAAWSAARFDRSDRSDQVEFIKLLLSTYEV